MAKGRKTFDNLWQLISFTLSYEVDTLHKKNIPNLYVFLDAKKSGIWDRTKDDKLTVFQNLFAFNFHINRK